MAPFMFAVKDDSVSTNTPSANQQQKMPQLQAAQCELWFPRLGECEAIDLRLICFPFAGGSAASFASWGAQLPTGVELRALQLPGRSRRMREPARHRIDELRGDILAAITPLLDRPCVLFGHSNGALLAYDLIHHLSATQRFWVRHFIVSAKPAPHVKSTLQRQHMNDAELLAELKRFGGTPPELLAHEELMALMLPMLRADFGLSENYGQNAGDRADHSTVLDCPASLWWGNNDECVSEDDVLAWQDYFSKPMQRQSFAGGHFYLQQSSQRVLSALNQILSQHLA